MAQSDFEQTVSSVVSGARTMAQARRRLLRKFPDLEMVGIEERGPAHYGIHIHKDGDPNKKLVEMSCRR